MTDVLDDADDVDESGPVPPNPCTPAKCRPMVPGVGVGSGSGVCAVAGDAPNRVGGRVFKAEPVRKAEAPPGKCEVRDMALEAAAERRPGTPSDSLTVRRIARVIAGGRCCGWVGGRNCCICS